MKSIAQPCTSVNALVSTDLHTEASPAIAADGTLIASSLLIAANQQLMARRAERSGCAVAAPKVLSGEPDIAAALHALPPHLGWQSGRAAAVLRVKGAAVDDRASQPLRIDISPICTTAKPKTTIKAYPTILSAMLNQERAAAGRVWLLCRHLDTEGRGWIDVTDLRQMLTKSKVEISSFILHPSSFPIFGWRRLRQILGQGKGVFWNRDERGRLWIFGAARVAANLGVERLQNRPIQLPISELTGTIGQVRAVFYAAFHAGRRDSQPISRVSIERATGVPARTQFHYEETARIKRRKNFTIGAGWGSVSAENSAYQHGNAVFEFIDYRGRHGKCGQTYAARQLPNSYLTRIQPCTRGRQRKVNARLADLVTWGAGERPEPVFDKLYYRDGGSIVQARAAVGSRDVSYWPQADDHPDSYALWHRRVGG